MGLLKNKIGTMSYDGNKLTSSLWLILIVYEFDVLFSTKNV